jgi:hypothetical protein
MTDLSQAEIAALQEICKGPLRTTAIAADILAKLKERGLVVERTFELFLTEAGERLLRQHRQ